MTAAAKLERLVHLRESMQRPEHMVILSLCGRIRTANPLIVVEDHEAVTDLDVRGLVLLDVEIAHIGKNLKRTQDIVWHVWTATDVESLSTCNYVTGQKILVGYRGKIYNKEAA